MWRFAPLNGTIHGIHDHVKFISFCQTMVLPKCQCIPTCNPQFFIKSPVGGWALPLWKRLKFVNGDDDIPNVVKIIQMPTTKPNLFCPRLYLATTILRPWKPWWRHAVAVTSLQQVGTQVGFQTSSKTIQDMHWTYEMTVWGVFSWNVNNSAFLPSARSPRRAPRQS